MSSKRAKRSLGQGRSIIDPPEVTDRLVALACWSFGESAHFVSRHCGGAEKAPRARRASCPVPGHGPRCKGKPYWSLRVLFTLPALGPTIEIIGMGSTPKIALRNALKARQRRGSRR